MHGLPVSSLFYGAMPRCVRRGCFGRAIRRDAAPLSWREYEDLVSIAIECAPYFLVHPMPPRGAIEQPRPFSGVTLRNACDQREGGVRLSLKYTVF